MRNQFDSILRSATMFFQLSLWKRIAILLYILMLIIKKQNVPHPCALLGKLQQNVPHPCGEAFLEQGKVFTNSDTQINDLRINLAHTGSQQKELQENLEKSRAQKEELWKKILHSEAQNKELKKTEPQRKALNEVLQKIEAQNKTLVL